MARDIVRAAAVVLILCGYRGGAIPSALGAQKECCKYKLMEYSISPNGKRLAGVIRVANARGATERIVIARLDRANSLWKPLYEGDPVSSVKWLNDATIAFVQNKRTGSLITENIHTHRIFRAATTPGPIFDYVPAPDGEKILYAFGDEPQAANWVSRAVPDRL